jgi:phosphate transport system protein
MQRHFDDELKELRQALMRMAALTEESIAKAVKALVERDKKLAQSVIKSDEAINMLEIELEEFCLKLFALRQPIARDLRLIAAAMKITNDLERIGDLSVNIAERTLDLLKEPALKPLLDIPQMAIKAQSMVADSLSAFVNNDECLAREVCVRDDEVDQLNHQIFRELLTYMLSDPRNIARSVDLILIGRHLERIADHATNIAEDVVFMVKGKNIKHHIEDLKRN